MCPAVREEGLRRRSDDNEETIRRRLAVYREEVEPLLAFYEEKGLLSTFEVLKGVKDAPALEKVMREG